MKCAFCKDEMKIGFVNYPLDLNDKFVLIKEVPALVCGQCGEYFLEDEVFQKIEGMVNEIKEKQFVVEIEVLRYPKSA